MSTIFSDNFSGYTPGTTTITGFFPSNNGSTLEVVNFGTMTGSTSAPGFYENTGQGITINGTINHQESTAASQTYIVWEGFTGNYYQPAPMISLGNANLSTATGSAAPITGIGGLVVNTDLTVSFVCTSTSTGNLYQGTAHIATTAEQVVFPFAWQYFQAAFTLGSVFVVGLGSVLTVTCTFAVDGTQVLLGTGTTGILISSLYGGGAGMNQWSFNNNEYLTNITGYANIGTGTIPAFLTWPNPVTPLYGFLTQGVVEMGRSTANQQARITQGVVEIPSIPTLRAARMTQGVVEIAGKFTLAGGWWVYEA